MVNRIPIHFVRVLALALLTGAAACTSSATHTYYDQCEPGVAPSEECYVEKRDPESEQVALATEIAHRWIDEHPAEEQPWDWGPGALMFSFTELYRLTGDQKLRDYYSAWLDHHIQEGYNIVWSDSCPPAIVAIALLSEASTDTYEQVVEDVLSYLDDVAPRTEDGGISHYGILGQGTSIWVDSLFMFGGVLTRWGELTDDPARLDMLSEQIRIFASRLQHDDGLFQHAFGFKPPPDNDLYWGRGNGWVVAALSDYLRVRVIRDERDPEVERVLRALVRGVVELQDPDTGLWWTIMNRPDEIYLETSAAALFAYGIARGFRYGQVGAENLEAARRAIEAVKQQIQRDAQDRPFVTGISGPTDPGSFEQYAAVPLVDDINHGVGATILALVETSGLPD